MYETYRMLGHEHEADLEREARKRALARGSAKNGSKWPMLVLAAVALVVVVLGATSAAASASNAPVVIPFEKHWVGPGHYVGTACEGGTIEMQVSNSSVTGNVQHFSVTIWATVPGHAFTAVLDGTFNFSTGKTLLNGTVTEGWLAGAQAHEEGQLVDPDTLTFTGTLQLMPASA
jgi:hypothetical protein